MTGLLSATLLVLGLIVTGPLPPVPPTPSPAPPRALSAEAPEAPAAWPLAPRPEVVSPFNPPEIRWGTGHRGVDLAGQPGQDVLAALPGTVTFAGSIAGRGVVVVTHGDRRTTYEPVEATRDVGDQVGAGDPIGVLQAGPGHCAPWTCLHWGLRVGEEYVDPLSLLQVGPVRLLPLGVVALLRLVGVPGGTRSAAVRW